MADLLNRVRAEAPQLARSAWKWWCGELAAVLPEAMRQAFGAWHRRLVLIVDGETATLAYETNGRCETVGPFDLDVEQPRQAADLLSLGKAVRGQRFAARLRLDPAIVLHVPMTLPLAALANLNQVIEFEFDRFSPFKRDLVYFRHRIAARDVESAHLGIDLTIVPRDLVDNLRWKAERNGLRIVGVDAAGAPLPLPSTASGGAGEPASRRLVPIAARAMFGVAGVLAVGLLIVPFFQNSAAIARLADEVALAKRQADASAKLQGAIDGEIHDQSFVIDRKKASPTVSKLLASLTHILPDDVWLTELQIEGNNVQLSGFAGSATTVLGLLDQSPLLGNAAFRSSVTQDAQIGRERFDITAQIRPKSGR
jgi:general secretion pathway protein L